MKKSIASLALAISATSLPAFALMPPPHPGAPHPAPIPVKTYCLAQYGQTPDGNIEAGSCDESEQNIAYGRPIKPSGCAEGQIVIKAVNLQLHSCPTAVQL